MFDLIKATQQEENFEPSVYTEKDSNLTPVSENRIGYDESESDIFEKEFKIKEQKYFEPDLKMRKFVKIKQKVVDKIQMDIRDRKNVADTVKTQNARYL